MMACCFCVCVAGTNAQPDAVVHFRTIKPVIYGSLAAPHASIPVLNAITGLGTAFPA